MKKSIENQIALSLLLSASTSTNSSTIKPKFSCLLPSYPNSEASSSRHREISSLSARFSSASRSISLSS